MTDPTLTRRRALFAAAALPLAGALPLSAGLTRPAQAAADPQGPALPLFQRFRLGSFEVTPLLAGTRTTNKPQETFGLNASAEDFAALAAQNFLPADRTQNFFTPTLVNTGAELVLFDTGLAPEGITAALAAAGHTPDQIDVVVLTHMHGDHIGGRSLGRGRHAPPHLPRRPCRPPPHHRRDGGPLHGLSITPAGADRRDSASGSRAPSR